MLLSAGHVPPQAATGSAAGGSLQQACHRRQTRRTRCRLRARRASRAVRLVFGSGTLLDTARLRSQLGASGAGHFQTGCMVTMARTRAAELGALAAGG